jgi:hypothetical protein
MVMKTVSQRVSKEIEYLSALAEMYEHDNNQKAREATKSAIAALTRLVEIIDHPKNEGSERLLEAA